MFTCTCQSLLHHMYTCNIPCSRIWSTSIFQCSVVFASNTYAHRDLRANLDLINYLVPHRSAYKHIWSPQIFSQSGHTLAVVWGTALSSAETTDCELCMQDGSADGHRRDCKAVYVRHQKARPTLPRSGQPRQREPCSVWWRLQYRSWSLCSEQYHCLGHVCGRSKNRAQPGISWLPCCSEQLAQHARACAKS
jgi:hypothetical protein